MTLSNFDIQTEYLGLVFRPKEFESTVVRAIALGKNIACKYKIDGIAFTGVSGAALGYILGYTLGLPLICVRRQGDGAHYLGVLEGCVSAKRYMIVDDFISSGDTVRRIMKTIKSNCIDSQCAAMMMFNQVDRRKTFHHTEENLVGSHRVTSEREIIVYSCMYEWGDYRIQDAPSDVSIAQGA